MCSLHDSASADSAASIDLLAVLVTVPVLQVQLCGARSLVRCV
jgi:hypothetical protein